ncbi:hypothetical protein [Clostridium tagluense]|uniref:Uncharacterized protein n=1 Tax=Clostridium tagluense TaxID=360422 RepID=A0A401UNF0_9CLOT|nr:hypothetical protein [Clostridium tagluense]GCD11062.1 hypothetical protein Ctaglu_26850 [Clostridium tagluense]
MSGDGSIKEKYQEEIVSFAKSIKETEELRKKFSESVVQFMDMLSYVGEKKVPPTLQVASFKKIILR